MSFSHFHIHELNPSKALAHQAYTDATPNFSRTSQPDVQLAFYTQFQKPSDATQSYLPNVGFTETANSRKDITVIGNNGHQDTVTGANPIQGETLPQFLKRMHPSLTDQQLAKQVKDTLKYNHDYGNDLGNGSQLNPNKAVYLTSVKTCDAQGRPANIESPNGRTTQLQYDSHGDISGYQINKPNGTIEEQVTKNSNGLWTMTRNDGTKVTLSDVQIDANGNITNTEQNGNKIAHLTRGDDMLTTYKNGQPAETTVYRNQVDANGKEQQVTESQYQYVYDGSDAKCYVSYPGQPGKKYLLDWNSYSDRISAAQGLGGASSSNLDERPDQVVEGNLQRRNLVCQALQLAGMPTTASNINDVCLIVDHESSWDPNSTNNYDWNAQHGHPSQGLMQTIPSTFYANAISGHNTNIKDPLSNLIAGIRYAVNRYGSLNAVPGVEAVQNGRAYVGY